MNLAEYTFLNKPKSHMRTREEGEQYKRFAATFGPDAEDVAREARQHEEEIAKLEAEREAALAEIVELQGQELKALSPGWYARQRRVNDIHAFGLPHIRSQIEQHRSITAEKMATLEAMRRDKCIADVLGLFDSETELLQTHDKETSGPAFSQKMMQIAEQIRNAYPLPAFIPAGAPFLLEVILRDHAHDVARLFHRIDRHGVAVPTTPGGQIDKSRKIRGIVEDYDPKSWVPHWKVFADWRPIIEESLYRAFDRAEANRAIPAGDGRQGGEALGVLPLDARIAQHRANEPILGTKAWDIWSEKALALNAEATAARHEEHMAKEPPEGTERHREWKQIANERGIKIDAPRDRVKPPEPLTAAEQEILREQTRAQLAGLAAERPLSPEAVRALDPCNALPDEI